MYCLDNAQFNVHKGLALLTVTGKNATKTKKNTGIIRNLLVPTEDKNSNFHSGGKRVNI